jgi:hypothetical protein
MQVSANRVVCLLLVFVSCVRTDSNCVGLSRNIHVQLQIRVIVFNIRLHSVCVDLHIREMWFSLHVHVPLLWVGISCVDMFARVKRSNKC